MRSITLGCWTRCFNLTPPVSSRRVPSFAAIIQVQPYQLDRGCRTFGRTEVQRFTGAGRADIESPYHRIPRWAALAILCIPCLAKVREEIDNISLTAFDGMDCPNDDLRRLPERLGTTERGNVRWKLNTLSEIRSQTISPPVQESVWVVTKGCQQGGERDWLEHGLQELAGNLPLGRLCRNGFRGATSENATGTKPLVVGQFDFSRNSPQYRHFFAAARIVSAQKGQALVGSGGAMNFSPHIGQASLKTVRSLTAPQCRHFSSDSLRAICFGFQAGEPGLIKRYWQRGQTSASSLIRLAHFGHFTPVVKASANPMGPNTAPRQNHRTPLAPRLDATTDAQMPNSSQMITKAIWVSVSST